MIWGELNICSLEGALQQYWKLELLRSDDYQSEIMTENICFWETPVNSGVSCLAG